MSQESPDSVVQAIARSSDVATALNQKKGGIFDVEAQVKDEDSEIIVLLSQGLSKIDSVIRRISPGIVRKGLGCIVELNLYNNELTSIKGLEVLHGLVSLNVSANNIEQFEITVLQKFIQLRHLDFGSNCLTAAKGIHTLSQLEELDLSYNRLSTLVSLSNDGAVLKAILRRRKVAETGAGNANAEAGIDVVCQSENKTANTTFRDHKLQRLALHGNCLDKVEELSHITGYPALSSLTMFSESVYGCDCNSAALDSIYKEAVSLLLPNIVNLDGKVFNLDKGSFKRLNNIDSPPQISAKIKDKFGAFEPFQEIEKQLQDIQQLKFDMQEFRIDRYNIFMFVF